LDAGLIGGAEDGFELKALSARRAAIHPKRNVGVRRSIEGIV
jgi:hypothetical protein